jgi:hypothetical protein
MGGLLMHYLWPTIPEFTVWHDTACTLLGIPHPNHNAATGEIDTDAQWTTSYTQATECADGFYAYVEDHIAAQLPDYLGTPYTPPTPEDDTP